LAGPSKGNRSFAKAFGERDLAVNIVTIRQREMKTGEASSTKSNAINESTF